MKSEWEDEIMGDDGSLLQVMGRPLPRHLHLHRPLNSRIMALPAVSMECRRAQRPTQLLNTSNNMTMPAISMGYRHPQSQTQPSNSRLSRRNLAIPANNKERRPTQRVNNTK
jgi:hypothetical protein